MDSPGNRSGFSLVEIIAAIAVAGILAGIAGIKMTGMIRKNTLKACAGKLASDIREARTRGRAEGRRAEIMITKDTARDLNGNGVVEHYMVFLDEDKNEIFSAGDTVVLENSCDSSIVMKDGNNPVPVCKNNSNARCVWFSVASTVNLDATERDIVMIYSGNPAQKARISIVSIVGWLDLEWSGDNGKTWSVF